MTAQVALVPWGTPVEEFLDPLGRTLDDFCERMDGGWLFGWCSALQQGGYAPRLVLSSRTVASPRQRRHLPTGTPVTVLPAPRPYAAVRVRGLRDLDSYRGLLPPGLLRVLGSCDAVFLQEYEDPRTDLLAWWGAVRRVPVLATFQGGSPPYGRAPLQALLRGPSVRRLAGLLVGSAAEAARVVAERGADPRRVHRVVNPVDAAAWAPGDRAGARASLALPADALVVAWHGRVDLRRKGLDVLADAWRRVVADRPGADLRLLLTGDGPDAPELAALLAGAAGVHWLREYAGPDRVRERLAACDVWVSPSRHEGFAVAPLEAMASGRAVVLADAPGAAELHAPVVVPRGDPAALAAGLLAVLGDPDRDALGAAARARVQEEFSVAAVAGQLDAALRAARPAGS